MEISEESCTPVNRERRRILRKRIWKISPKTASDRHRSFLQEAAGKPCESLRISACGPASTPLAGKKAVHGDITGSGAAGASGNARSCRLASRDPGISGLLLGVVPEQAAVDEDRRAGDVIRVGRRE